MYSNTEHDEVVLIDILSCCRTLYGASRNGTEFLTFRVLSLPHKYKYAQTLTYFQVATPLGA